MSLKLALLKKIKHRPTKIVAQCPACAEAGGDSKGVHLVVYPDGRFGCTAHPKDKSHRRRVAELAGNPIRQVKPWTLRLHGKLILCSSQPHSAAGIPIASLARSSVKGLKRSGDSPSETSVKALSDKTDALEHSTHCTGTKRDSVHIGRCANPSEASEDVIIKALALFDGKIVAAIPPDAIVPGRFRDVLATWTPTRNHPGLQGYTPRRLHGWTNRGSPVC